MLPDGKLPIKQNVLGTPISMTCTRDVIDCLHRRPQDQTLVVAVCNVHSIMNARRDLALARALARSDIAVPDGRPVVWALRALATSAQEQIRGADLMRAALTDRRLPSLRHFFFGSTPETLERMVRAARRLVPAVQIVGTFSPPFRPLQQADDDMAVEAILECDAEVIWVGLGMPKQELWMDRVHVRLPGTALIGVGAAFDFLAGNKRQAPRWMISAGLEWLHRLVHEPRRLWRRYILNNPAFIILLSHQLLRDRLTRSRDSMSR